MTTPLAIYGLSQNNLVQLRQLHDISVIRKRRVISPLTGLSFTPAQEVPFKSAMPTNGYWGGSNCADTLYITGQDENGDAVTIKCPVWSSDQINQIATLVDEINKNNAQQGGPAYPPQGVGSADP